MRPNRFKVGDNVFSFELSVDDQPTFLAFQITKYGPHRWEVRRLRKDGTISGVRTAGAFHASGFGYHASPEEAVRQYAKNMLADAARKEAQAKRRHLEAEIAIAALDKLLAAKVCDVKPHFECDGTGRMCSVCFESEAACQCEDEPKTTKCEDCDGAGKFCVAHESPCGDLMYPPRCDKKKAEEQARAESATG